jgi:membrane peptidoglycan carboxypeptidase
VSNPFWATSRGLSRSLGWVLRLGVIVMAGALLTTAVVAGIAPRAWHLANAHEEVPVVLPAWEDLAQRTYVYDRYGTQIAVYQLENSQPVSLNQIPQNVIQAFLAVEDRTFYSHDGVNIRSLARAVLSNAEGGSARQGASTITQQVVKIEYLAGLERDGRYKILQAHYALMLEREKSKNEILERYLNTAFFGNNAYGIQAAAEVYFGKRVEELLLEEGAFLAGLVQAPSSYDPIRRPEFSQRRFELVLDALVDTELITEEQRDALLPEGANAFQLPDQVKALNADTSKRTFYTEAVKDYLLNRSDILGATTQERYNRLFRGGLHIYTTLDPKVQLATDEARNQKLGANVAGVQTALISLDAKTGAIRAMTSGRPFEAGKNEINLTLNPRQTGSSIKMFLLAAAIQAGAQGNDLIDGPSSCVMPNPGNNVEPTFPISGTGRGIATLQVMTAASINCAYGRLAQIVGLQRNVDSQLAAMDNAYLRERQADPNLPPEKKVEPIASMATGGNEMSPLDMASGAQTIANYGVHHEPYYVERIDAPTGTVYVHDDPGTQVFTTETAQRTIEILKTVLTEGTARRSPLAGRTAAGKTGTQHENTNAWFVGFTPELVTAVWVGNPERGNFEMSPSNVPEFGTEVQGGLVAAPIWKVAMDAALAGVPPSDWTSPPPYPRPPARLYLPGTECIYTVVTEVVEPDPNAETVPPETGPDGLPVATEPPAPETRSVLSPVPDANTSLPQDRPINPTAPVPSIASGRQVSRCGLGGTPTAGPTTTTTQPPGG